jgi:hypothetical protein
MNRSALQVVVGFALLIGLTAALLVRVRANYVLGEPGVMLANIPIYGEKTNVVSEISAFLPEKIGEYTSSRTEPVTDVELQMLPPDTVYGRRIYTAPDRWQSMVSIVVMGTDRTSIHKPQYCLVGQGEQIVGSEVITIPIAGPRPYDLQVMKLTTRSQRHIGGGKFVPASGFFLYWFVADGQLTPHHGERMWLMARDLVTKGLLQRWAYVAYYSICTPGQEEALLERMKSFVAQSVPEFQKTTGAPASSALADHEPAQKLVQN